MTTTKHIRKKKPEILSILEVILNTREIEDTPIEAFKTVLESFEAYLVAHPEMVTDEGQELETADKYVRLCDYIEFLDSYDCQQKIKCISMASEIAVLKDDAEILEKHLESYQKKVEILEGRVAALQGKLDESESEEKPTKRGLFK